MTYDKNMIFHGKEYQVDIHKIIKIREYLLGLKEIEGMDDVKNEIVEIILGFLADPEKYKMYEVVIAGPSDEVVNKIVKILGDIYDIFLINQNHENKKIFNGNIFYDHYSDDDEKMENHKKIGKNGFLLIDYSDPMDSDEEFYTHEHL